MLESVVLPRRLGPHHRSRAVRRRVGRRRQGRRLPRRARHRPTLDDRDLRRHPARHRQPALVGRAVLPAHGQAPGPSGHRGGGLLQAGPAPALRTAATESLSHNALVIRVQPDEGVTLRFGSKVPGTQMEIRDVNMDFAYGGSFTEASPEAYERLILDVLLGEPPLFPRHEEVEQSWRILDPVIDALGRPREARALPERHLGPRGGRRDAGPRGPGLEATMTTLGGHATPTGSPQRCWRRQPCSAGSPAMGMVMTMVVVVPDDDAEEALEAAREAAREHPSRLLAVIIGSGARVLPDRRRDPRPARAPPASGAHPARGPGRPAPRVGGPPAAAPRLPRRRLVADGSTAGPCRGPVGRLGTRRITDAALAPPGRARAMLDQCESYAPGNTDLAWTRITPWRALLAAALDQISAKVTRHRHRRARQPERGPPRRLAGRPAGGRWAPVAPRAPASPWCCSPPGRRRSSGPDRRSPRRAEGARPAGPAGRPAPAYCPRAADRGAASARPRRRLRRHRPPASPDAQQEANLR